MCLLRCSDAVILTAEASNALREGLGLSVRIFHGRRGLTIIGSLHAMRFSYELKLTKAEVSWASNEQRSLPIHGKPFPARTSFVTFMPPHQISTTIAHDKQQKSGLRPPPRIRYAPFAARSSVDDAPAHDMTSSLQQNERVGRR